MAHAQKITHPPRQLLVQVGNLELVSLSQPEICCGSAGTYNLDQPEIANELGRRKVEAIIESGCERVVTGNIGCLIQLRRFLHERKSPIRAMHLVELLQGESR